MFANIPTALTWLRIVLIPVFVAVYYLPDAWLGPAAKNWTAMIDLRGRRDHRLARRLAGAPLNQTSAFGAFLDPVADKLMVAAALILLVQLGRVDALVALIIIGREIAISALREWMAQLGAAQERRRRILGKLKTVAQMMAIIALLLWEPVLPGRVDAAHRHLALWIAAVLTLWSMFHYLKLAAPHVAGALSDRPGADD